MNDFNELVQAKSYRDIARLLLVLERERGALDLDAMAEDPEAAISAATELEIEYDPNPRRGCSVFGYYRFRQGEPSLIVVHPSLTSARDTFTLLHEVGHHIQRHHIAWANVRYSLLGDAGEKLEERVADSIAAELLFPDAAGLSHLDPAVLAHVHERSRASRSAIAMRAAEIAAGESAVVAVVDRDGVVIFARACGDDLFAPARGSTQPDLVTLIETARISGTPIAAELPTGILASSGWVQGDVTASVALDYLSSYAFVVLRPSQRFGRVPVWDRAEQECLNEACGAVFVVDGSITRCVECGEAKCPDCNRCACERQAGVICERCFMELSVAEQSGEREHECL